MVRGAVAENGWGSHGRSSWQDSPPPWNCKVSWGLCGVMGEGCGNQSVRVGHLGQRRAREKCQGENLQPPQNHSHLLHGWPLHKYQPSQSFLSLLLSPCPWGTRDSIREWERSWSRARKDPLVPTPQWQLPDWSAAWTEWWGGARVWREKFQLELEPEVLILDYTFLGIYPFLLGYPFYWHIIVPSDILWSFVFLRCHFVTSFLFLILFIWTLSLFSLVYFFFFFLGWLKVYQSCLSFQRTALTFIELFYHFKISFISALTCIISFY